MNDDREHWLGPRWRPIAAVFVAMVISAGTAFADTPGTNLIVTPSTNLNPAGQNVQVSGTGFGPNGSGVIRQCIQVDEVTEECSNNIGTFPTSASGMFGPVSVSVMANFTPDGTPRVCSAAQPCSVFAEMNAQPQNAHEPISFAPVDTTPPTCTYTIVAANPKGIDFTVSDAGSGISTISITTQVNIQPVIFPFFSAGTNSPISFSAVKDNQTLSSRVAVVITDVQGNKASCI